MGCIMKMYRDWQLSGDDNTLRKLWPNVRKAVEFCWIKGGWDADRDGVMEGCQHNTMDVEYYGPNPQMEIWYLGALRAAEEMAKGAGDKAFAALCRDLFDKATPSASGSAALALARLARKRDDTALATEAAEAVAEVSWLMTRSPHGTESWFLALEELLAQVSQGAVRAVVLLHDAAFSSPAGDAAGLFGRAAAAQRHNLVSHRGYSPFAEKEWNFASNRIINKC